MKKEMSSFDVRSIATELSQLEGAHMDKIFQWGAGNVLFRINVQGEGKKDLFFKDKKWLYSPAQKPETPIQPTSFATYLRKYIDNARIGKVRQIGFDRVIEMELLKADAEYKLIFEIFGGGNVLLVKDGIIDTCLIQKTMRDRKVRPKEEYIWPQPRFNPIESTEDDFKTAFRESEADCVRTLATAVNLGGQYAEEVCKRSGVDKMLPAKEVQDDMLSKMYLEVKDIVKHVIDVPETTAYLKDGKIEDFAPIQMASHDDLESKRFDSMSAVIDAFVKQIAEEEEENYVDPEVLKLNRRITKQEETVDEYRMHCDELKKKAEALYSDYQKVSQLLEVLNEQSKKLTWEKLKEGAMKIPYVRSIDPSKNLVTGEFGGEVITLDYTKGIDANASDIYQDSKEIGEKGKHAEEALNQSRAELAKLEKGLEKQRIANAGKAQPTKQFWFERFKWFFTSEGKLVIAGRDAHTNDGVVKKHLKEKDLYAHTDIHGAPSTILKDGASATNEELRQACQFATAQSKGWVAAVSEGSAYWVYPDQVSKTPNPGEFVPRGAFIIRGKRNYEYHLPMELAVGEIYFQGARKIMCGPEQAFRDCERMLIIRPAKSKTRLSGEMAKRFNVPEEEISRILPPGDIEIVREKWPKEEESE
ncbi:MAG: fibronectin-binding domain-containing protein [Thermoplasmata archaeon]|nr:fibronectin-binding domain-containing protein [Thermoplasmata archaeon]